MLSENICYGWSSIWSEIQNAFGIKISFFFATDWVWCLYLSTSRNFSLTQELMDWGFLMIKVTNDLSSFFIGEKIAKVNSLTRATLALIPNCATKFVSIYAYFLLKAWESVSIFDCNLKCNNIMWDIDTHYFLKTLHSLYKV